MKKLIKKILKENTDKPKKFQKFIDSIVDGIIYDTKIIDDGYYKYEIITPWGKSHYSIDVTNLTDNDIIWRLLHKVYLAYLEEKYGINKELLIAFGYRKTRSDFGETMERPIIAEEILKRYISKLRKIVMDMKMKDHPEWFETSGEWKNVKKGWDTDAYGDEITSWKDDPALDDDFSYLYEDTNVGGKLKKIVNKILNSIDVYKGQYMKVDTFTIEIGGIISPNKPIKLYMGVNNLYTYDSFRDDLNAIDGRVLEDYIESTNYELRHYLFVMFRVDFAMDDVEKIDKLITDVITPMVNDKIKNSIEEMGYNIVYDDDTINEQYDYSPDKLFSKDYVLRLTKRAPKHIKRMVDSLDVFECNAGECVKLPEVLYVYLKGRY